METAACGGGCALVSHAVMWQRGGIRDAKANERGSVWSRARNHCLARLVRGSSSLLGPLFLDYKGNDVKRELNLHSECAIRTGQVEKEAIIARGSDCHV